MISPPWRSVSTPSPSTTPTGDASLPLETIGFAIFGLLSGAILEFQSRFARRFRQGFDAPVIPQSAAVEYDLGNVLGLRLLRRQLANLLRALDRALRPLQVGGRRARERQGHPGGI